MLCCGKILVILQEGFISKHAVLHCRQLHSLKRHAKVKRKTILSDYKKKVIDRKCFMAYVYLTTEMVCYAKENDYSPITLSRLTA